MNNFGKNRITAIDLLRGTIMIIMALDHVRDYLFTESFFYDPLDLSRTSGPIFFTRWITHFCAPIFMLLAGTSAYLIGQRKSRQELSGFLLKRGIWLIVLELTVVNLGWNFNLEFPMFFFITIWALGLSMIILAAFIYLPIKVILPVCIVIIAGHDLLDGVHFDGNSFSSFLWSLLHDQRFFTWNDRLFLVGYPIVPLMAVMPLGYCLGAWYTTGYDVAKRQRQLKWTGFTAVTAFVLIRLLNTYGDPIPWTTQKDTLFTFLSFINVNKYPPSLSYLLLTLGSACLFLSFTERLKGPVVRMISVYGRVPMFYYLIHIYVIHAIAMLTSALTPGQDWRLWILHKPIWFTEDLKGYGFSLPVTYLIWIVVVIGLYPLCQRYDAYKQAHKDKWWLSYL